MRMKVAVTGARGFIGRYVVDHLRKEGHTVCRLGRGENGEQARLDDSKDNDSLLDAVDAVVHLAARTVDSLDTPFTAYVEPNVNLTERLLQEAAASGVSRFVFASSRMVYPATLGRQANEEDADPDTFYGLSKHVAERLVFLHCDRAGMSGIGLRLAQVVGPGDGGRGALQRLVEQARMGGPILIKGSGEAVRDFVHVRDVADAIAQALSTTQSGIYNLGLGGRSIRQLAEDVAEASGLQSSAIQTVPTDHNDMSVYSLNCDLAARHLRWQPSIGFPELIRQLIDTNN